MKQIAHIVFLMFTSATATFSQEAAQSTLKLELFRFTDKQETEQQITGKTLIESADGGVLVEDRAGTLWNITPKELLERKETGEAYTPLRVEERINVTKAELGRAADVLQTEHYLIVSNAGPAYTKWCGDQLERFYAAFLKYWAEEAELKLSPPTEKLVVIVLADEQQFKEFSGKDLGQRTQSSFGYYSIRKNRVVLYDFATDGEELDERGVRFAVKKVPFNVATVIHEATHQLAFNTGLHKRYTGNPVWLTEGLAMFCETPDTGKSTWKKIGRTNDWRKKPLKQYLGRMSADTVKALIQSDDRFQKAETAGDAYTESWALTMYLMKRKPKQFAQYIRKISEKRLLDWGTPEERLTAFRELIGDPADFEVPMKSYLKRVR